MFCDFLNNPKPKFVVVVHVDFDENLLLVFIVNSKISRLFENDQELKNAHLKIEKSTYTFLDHDSYINCVEVRDGLDIDFAIDHLLANPRDHKGQLSKNDVQEIIHQVEISHTISDYDKSIIIKSLSP
jgi:hypothetical protein